MILLYSKFVYPLAWMLAWALRPFSTKLRTGFKMRSTKPWTLVNIRNPIWVHCSSHEFEYAKGFLREIKKTYPEAPTLVTYFSPSVIRSVSEFEQAQAHCPSPWEFTRTLSGFLDRINPRALFVARTDLWPGVLFECKKRQIPVILFSHTCSKNSRSWLSRRYLSWAYKQLEHIYCVTEDDKIWIQSIAPKARVTAIGDSRYDQAVFRLQSSKKKSENLFSDKHKYFIFPSLVVVLIVLTQGFPLFV